MHTLMTDAARPYDHLLDSLRGAAPWAATRTDPAPQPVHEPEYSAATEWESVGALIARRCASAPSTAALHTDDGDLTYRELDVQADATATALVRAGFGKGDIVALVFERSAEFVVAVLAVWRAGAAYLPLSPGHPEAWLAEAARQAKVSLVLGRPIPGHPSLQDVPEHAGPVRDVNAPGDLAYVIATSGSTGTPKLVMIEHRGLAHLARAQRVFFGGLPSRTRVLLFAHPAFDAALFDVVLALTNGVRLDIPDVSIHSGEPLARVLADRRITHAVLPAAVLRTLRPGRFPGLEVLISIGDVCLPETARGWAPHHRFVNGYGPTETTICATLHTVAGTESTRVPIGRPIAGTHIVVLDDDQRPVPTGSVGEICIGGPGVGPGYLGDPELTARRFIENPGAGRLYRSGDLGRLLADGTLEFLGRADDQVKVRGARIELGQVEAALAAQPGVRDALALVDRAGDSVVGVPRYAEPGRISQLAGGLVTVPASGERVLPSSRGALEGVTLAWEFDTDLFDDVFCTHMPQAYERLLRSLVDEPQAPIARLDLVDEATREELLRWGRGPTIEPAARWLPDLVSRWARETPDAPAVTGPAPLTYAELEAHSDRVALHLRAAGLGPGDVVAVRVPLSRELVVAQLAVMKSGAAFLPSDPGDPASRLAALMADCGARVLLTTRALAREAVPEGVSTIVLEAVADHRGPIPPGRGRTPAT